MLRRTLFTVLEDTATQYPSNVALYQPVKSGGAGKYQSYTWSDYRDTVRELACGLRTLGVGKGDVVALHSETRAEFYLADVAVMSNGSIAAALYTSLADADHVRTLEITRSKAIFVEDAKTMHALQSAGAARSGLHWILLTGEAEGAKTLAELRAIGQGALLADPGFFELINSEVLPEDHAILYLTSGATGEPKMGLATHAAVVANIDMAPDAVPIGPEDSTLVFLPSAHIAQRIVLELLPIRVAMPVYFSEGLAKMPAELRQIKPTFLLAPPRVWERVFASITTEVKKKPAFARRLFQTGLGLGLRVNRLRAEGKDVPAWMQQALLLADKLLFTKIRNRLGGRLRIAISGAAPLGRDLALFFEAVGLPLLEGYGLTEGGVATLNPVDRPKAGSIGKPLNGVEVKIAPDGELLIKSPCLFTGYFEDPVSTAAVLRDGWLYTGDIATLDSDGYVSITGRKKELIVSSNGKKIYPARIESLFKTEPIISQVLLVGDRQPYVTALITINPETAGRLQGMTAGGGSLLEMSGSTLVQEEVGRVVKSVNKQLAPFEQIKRFRILDRDFTIDRGELTPTMKVRRTKVIENFRSTVNELYLGKEEMV